MFRGTMHSLFKKNGLGGNKGYIFECVLKISDLHSISEELEKSGKCLFNSQTNWGLNPSKFSFYVVQPIQNPTTRSHQLENLLPFTSYQLVIRQVKMHLCISHALLCISSPEFKSKDRGLILLAPNSAKLASKRPVSWHWKSWPLPCLLNWLFRRSEGGMAGGGGVQSGSVYFSTSGDGVVLVLALDQHNW